MFQFLAVFSSKLTKRNTTQAAIERVILNRDSRSPINMFLVYTEVGVAE
ncbi:hypothetical protein IQ238_18100 [Pleurocapsales cyanobacterium LEGE 06147]|nr:hypothetical protein [Pleurocapsales cyanobacterium LEGE 06147]